MAVIDRKGILESSKLKTCCEQVKFEEAQRVERWVRGFASLGFLLLTFGITFIYEGCLISSGMSMNFGLPVLA